MVVKKYRKIILSKRPILLLVLMFYNNCTQPDAQKEGYRQNTYNDEYRKVLDFSTSSNYIISKVGDGIDTMTLVLPSEILGRYLRQTFSSDSMYADAILSTVSNGAYLLISPKYFNVLRSYSVTFSDGFIFSWNQKSSLQIAEAFFSANASNKFYSCFEDEIHRNQILYLLVMKGSKLYKDDETGCVVLRPNHP